MPLEDEKELGKNSDGSSNEDYCCYCFSNDRFIKDETLEEMIESCIAFRISDNCPDVETARAKMMEYMPNLKRWKKK